MDNYTLEQKRNLMQQIIDAGPDYFTDEQVLHDWEEWVA